MAQTAIGIEGGGRCDLYLRLRTQRNYEFSMVKRGKRESFCCVSTQTYLNNFRTWFSNFFAQSLIILKG